MIRELLNECCPEGYSVEYKKVSGKIFGYCLYKGKEVVATGAAIKIFFLLDKLTRDICSACYGKGYASVYQGAQVGSPDFPGDSYVLVKKPGVENVECSKCHGGITSVAHNTIERNIELRKLMQFLDDIYPEKSFYNPVKSILGFKE